MNCRNRLSPHLQNVAAMQMLSSIEGLVPEQLSIRNNHKCGNCPQSQRRCYFSCITRTNDASELDRHLNIASRHYAAPEDPEVIGCILNKVNQPEEVNKYLYAEARYQPKAKRYNYEEECTIFSSPSFKLIGSIPWRKDLIAREPQTWQNNWKLSR